MHSQREKSPNPLSIPLQTLDVFCAEVCAGMRAGIGNNGDCTCCVVLLVSADSRCLFQLPEYWTATGRGWGIAGTAFGREEFAALAKK